MCIALLSTAHPSYQLILINNRDEYLNRPTAPAQWWPAPDSDVLGGRDLLRKVQGTWLGVTKTGKIAVLTNFRENTTPPPEAVSRGAIIRKWLAEDVGTTEDFVQTVVNTGIARDAGGFSLVCGNLGERLAVISNRAADHSEVPWVGGETIQTIGLSNAAFTDRSWSKVRRGEELMLQTIRDCVRDDVEEDTLIKKFLQILSLDTLKRSEAGQEAGVETYITELRNTILVPPLGKENAADLPGDEIALAERPEKALIVTNQELVSKQSIETSGLYGTQKQTVILANRSDHVRFFERTLFDSGSKPIPHGEGDIDIEFDLSR